MRPFLILVLLSLFMAQTGFAGTVPFVALVTLDEAVRNVMQQGQNKVLATRTETIAGKRVYIIKVLTPKGRIQHIKIDAQSGRTIR